MMCAGCRRELEVGDRYIKDTASGFSGKNATPVVDDLIAEIMGGRDGQILFCEDCTEEGDYLFDTVYGDERDDGGDRVSR